MNWNEFKENVEKWAEERGIYEHSTPEAQLLKTLSELGELADAIIKNDRDALKDAIGDVAVCWVNYCYMRGFELQEPPRFTNKQPERPTGYLISHSLRLLAAAIDIGSPQGYNLFLDEMLAISNKHELCFMDCCESAWNEIKDRKGRMVPGGAFVKEG